MSRLTIVTKGEPIFKISDETAKTFDVSRFSMEKDEATRHDILSFTIAYRDEKNKKHFEDVVLDIQEELLIFSVDGALVFPIIEQAEEFVQINFKNNKQEEGDDINL